MKKGSGAKIVLYVLLGFIVLTGIFIGTLFLMFPPQKIKAMVIPQVEKALGRKVSVEGAGISMYPVFGISLSGVSISNTERDGFSDDHFVKLDQFLIQISVPSIITGKPEISKIILRKPSILLEIDEKGSFNYSDMTMLKSDSTVKKDEKKSSGMPVLPIPISLKNFTIEKGSITYIDKKGKQEFIIGEINQQVAFAIDKQLRDISTTGNLVLSNVSVKDKSISRPLKNLTITLSHQIGANLVDGTATVKELRLSFQKVFLNMSGTVSGLNETPVFDLKIDSDPIQVADILAEIPNELAPDLAKLKANGILDLDLLISGSFKENQSLPVKGALKVTDCSVKYSDLPKSINTINASIKFTDTSLQVEQLQCKFGENPISISALISNFKKPVIDCAIKAKIDLGDMKDIMMLAAGTSVTGLVDLDITAKGEVDPKDPSRLDLKGKTDLTNVAVLWPPLVKPAVVNGSFNLSSQAIGENLSVVIGSSSLTMNASVSNYLTLLLPDSTRDLPRPKADFTLQSPMLDVDEFMPPSKDTSKVAVTNTNNTQTQSAPLLAPLPGVDMKGSVNAKKIIYTGIEMDNCVMKINVINDIADVDIKTGFSEGTIEDVVHADLRNTKNISFTNKLKVANIQVAELLDRFGNFIQPTTPLNRQLINLKNNLSGSINMTSNMMGNGGTSADITKSLEGNIDAKIADGKISNSLIAKRLGGVIEKFMSLDDITFRDLSAKLKIANERVSFEQCDIQAQEAGDWDIKGDVGFDASLALKVNTRLSKNVSQKALSVQNSGKNLLKGLLEGTKLAGASGLIDNAGVPSDKEGRITLKLGLEGTAANPQARFLGFGEGSGGQATAEEKPSMQQQLKEKAQAVLDTKKEELEQKLVEERKRAEALLQQKLEEQKLADEANKLLQDENAKKQAEELKKKAGSALKKLF